jgi:hypothetical protein
MKLFMRLKCTVYKLMYRELNGFHETRIASV